MRIRIRIDSPAINIYIQASQLGVGLAGGKCGRIRELVPLCPVEATLGQNCGGQDGAGGEHPGDTKDRALPAHVCW